MSEAATPGTNIHELKLKQKGQQAMMKRIVRKGVDGGFSNIFN
jgi:hypothetical protein